MELKIYNAHSRRKEKLPDHKGLIKLYVSAPLLEDKRTPATLRLNCLLDWLGKALQRKRLKFERVSEAATADCLLITDEEERKQAAFTLLPGAPDLAINPGDLIGFSPAELRYWLASTHYRDNMPPLRALTDSATALERLRSSISRLKAQNTNGGLAESGKASASVEEWRNRFYEQIADDLNLPRALTVLWAMLLQSDLDDASRLRLLAEFDRVLGFELGLDNPAPAEPKNEPTRYPDKKAKNPVTGREGAKGTPRMSDSKNKPFQKKPQQREQQQKEETQGLLRLKNSRIVRSFLREEDRFDFTVCLVSRQNLPELKITLNSLLAQVINSKRTVETIVVDLNGAEETTTYLQTLNTAYRNFRALFAEDLGVAAARNIAFRQARGRWLLLLEPGLKLKGDLFDALYHRLYAMEEYALYGLAGLKLERQEGKAVGLSLTGAHPDALEGSLLCFRRVLVEDEVGFMDEHFRHPYALEADYSYNFKDKGFGLMILPDIEPLLERTDQLGTSPHYGFSPEEEERQRRKNWELFLRSWNLQ
ncbi:MAG: glycosyltransferase [Chloroflexi bacterium]|uniref:Glycosyltransferase n=1 Tax=Candidatus Chlorohelix allophototropha TaxID=3003348 RepID=A0A8T7LV69_9CHLR|nr:glycosyltransferase [Chloroflexota bacterium]WJW67785.1 glycosyltransferase [Chloroflexota bacterium L227-S17]